MQLVGPKVVSCTALPPASCVVLDTQHNCHQRVCNVNTPARLTQATSSTKGGPHQGQPLAQNKPSWTDVMPALINMPSPPLFLSAAVHMHAHTPAPIKAKAVQSCGSAALAVERPGRRWGAAGCPAHPSKMPHPHTRKQRKGGDHLCHNPETTGPVCLLLTVHDPISHTHTQERQSLLGFHPQH